MSTIQLKNNFLSQYLTSLNGKQVETDAVAFYAMLDHIATVSPIVVQSIVQELKDQRSNLKLTASENFCSLATQFAQGNLLTDKYAEGFAHHRFYAGCDNVDAIEEEASKLACELFGADHAYVQPHSGSDANLVAYIAILSKTIQEPLLEKIGITNPSKLNRDDWQKVREAMHNQKLLALDYYSGGHLTHGYRHNLSSLLFDVYTYSVDQQTQELNLDTIREQAKEIKPLVLLTGYSAYPRKINFAKMREIADEVGAVFMVDMAHFAGLVAGKVFSGDYDPVAHAHVVTLTTHKSLRGPRGGVVLCKNEFAEWVDKGCPSVLGGPLPNIMAAKAVAFKEALKPEFKDYAAKIVENSQNFAQECKDQGMHILTGGTDNHLFLIDVDKSFGLTGRQAETALRSCNITLNRNSLPFDKNGPWYTSGLRIGTPAVTTLGMGPDQMKEIAQVIQLILSNTTPSIVEKGEKQGQKSLAKFELSSEVQVQATNRITSLLNGYVLYPVIDMNLLSS